MTDLEMLTRMVELQRKLDNRIMGKFMLTSDDVIPYISMALTDEVGELTHALKPEWVWWKENPGEVNRDEVLEEYVDVVHFVLMEAIERKSVDELIEGFTDGHSQYLENLKTTKPYFIITTSTMYERGLKLYALSVALGFTWKEVYEEYLRKNKVNFKRQENHY